MNMFADTTVGSTPLTFQTVWTRFGDGVANELPATLNRLGVTSPIVVTDRGIKESGVLNRVVEPLNEYEVYYATHEPTTEDFEDFMPGDTDGVVAVGGGSCIDTAKLLSILQEYGDDIEEYIGVDTVPGPTSPLVAIPTTSGTGSQATQTSVIIYNGVKRGVSDRFLRADAALVDPSLTFELPTAVTRTSGFDAFVHSLESLTARDYRWIDERPITYQGANPASRALAAKALALTHDSLERAVGNGDDREARRQLSLGSHLAGAAFSISGLGAVHALASTVGGLRDQPHGACLAVSIEPGLRYNLPVNGPKYAAVARWLGVSKSSHDPTAAAALINECTRIRDSIGLPNSFKDFDFTADDVDTLVENTLVQERRLTTNPRVVSDDLASILYDELE